MANICIIPARGGSKRIPKKNIKYFFGKPIIAYTIETAKESKLFDEIMVSTDDKEIAEIARKYGAKVPFIRSQENSNDFATLAQVVVEVISIYQDQNKQFDKVCCIIPTAALLTTESLVTSYQLLNKDVTSVIPVLKFSYPIQRALINENDYLKMADERYLTTRSQDLPICYHDSGQFYWLNTLDFMKEKKIFTNKAKFIELSEYEAQDVDTMEDWTMLKLKYKLLKKTDKNTHDN